MPTWPNAASARTPACSHPFNDAEKGKAVSSTKDFVPRDPVTGEIDYGDPNIEHLPPEREAHPMTGQDSGRVAAKGCDDQPIEATLRQWIEAIHALPHTSWSDAALWNGGCISDDLKTAADEIDGLRAWQRARLEQHDQMNAEIERLRAAAPQGGESGAMDGEHISRRDRDVLRRRLEAGAFTEVHEDDLIQPSDLKKLLDEIDRLAASPSLPPPPADPHSARQ